VRTETERKRKIGMGRKWRDRWQRGGCWKAFSEKDGDGKRKCTDHDHPEEKEPGGERPA
jgi:hypothetical protein